MTDVLIMMVVGTRPEAIKVAPVYIAARNREGVLPILISTGQHRELTREVLSLFGIVPDVDLDVMEDSQSLGALASRVTIGLNASVSEYCPSAILVQGDTTTAMLGAMMGFYSAIPVGHIEAGLRTYNIRSPYPEEYNRRCIAVGARWHFAPTELSASALRKERLDGEVFIVGNTVIDAAQIVGRLGGEVSLPLEDGGVFRANRDRRLVLVTAHRRENLGAPMAEIGKSIRDLAERYPGADFVLPLHPNPSIGQVLKPILSGMRNIKVVASLRYDVLIAVLKRAYLVLTDSGGIQEEASAFSTPVLVLRSETERMEGINAGCSKLVGTKRADIVDSTRALFENQELYAGMSGGDNPYGDGEASQRIISIVQGGLT